MPSFINRTFLFPWSQRLVTSPRFIDDLYNSPFSILSVKAIEHIVEKSNHIVIGLKAMALKAEICVLEFNMFPSYTVIYNVHMLRLINIAYSPLA